MALPLPPIVYYPRCLVALQILVDDHVPGLPTPPQLLTNYGGWTCIPRSIEVNRNSTRKADTARIELDYADFPLDPRLIKDMIVAVHLQGMPSSDFPMAPLYTNLRFIGRVDEPKVNMSASGQTVTLEARDYTGIWLDFRWPALKLSEGAEIDTPGAPTLPCPPGTTLGALIELMRLQVTPERPILYLDPTIAAIPMATIFAGAFFVSKDDDSAWDVLCALCDLVGFTPVWNLDVLEIRTPTLANPQGAIMVYGQNVERLSFSRNLKQNEGKQVLIRAYNPLTGIPASAVYPDPLSPDYSAVARLGSGKTPKIKLEQVQYNIEGPYTTPLLKLIAQRVWTEMRQQQVIGELETCHMTDILNGDLLGLSNGDQLICRLGTEDQAAISHMTPAEAVLFLSDPTRPNFLHPAAAQLLVQAWAIAQQLNITFYVTEAVHTWDATSGYRLRLRFRDFILGV